MYPDPAPLGSMVFPFSSLGKFEHSVHISPGTCSSRWARDSGWSLGLYESLIMTMGLVLPNRYNNHSGRNLWHFDSRTTIPAYHNSRAFSIFLALYHDARGSVARTRARRGAKRPGNTRIQKAKMDVTEHERQGTGKRKRERALCPERDTGQRTVCTLGGLDGPVVKHSDGGSTGPR